MATTDAPPDRWRVVPQAAGQRLDSYLAAAYKTSRNQAARWIRDGRVTVGARAPKPSLRLEGGEWVSCEPAPISQEGVLEPEQGEIRIIFEDRSIVVLDKQPDIVVHPGAGREGGTLANRLLAAYPEIATVGGPGRPGIVHRLDKGTSGVMIVARTPEAYQKLSTAFTERRVSKAYLAVVYGAPEPSSGLIDAPIARHPRQRKQMTVSSQGRPARTRYETRASIGEASVVELDLETGRTHQIRVHLKHLGHPIVGDPVYGEARWKNLSRKRSQAFRHFSRPALHAWRLGLRHPESGQMIDLVAPVPPDLTELWARVSGADFPAD